jgi:hypothetical protein
VRYKRTVARIGLQLPRWFLTEGKKECWDGWKNYMDPKRSTVREEEHDTVNKALALQDCSAGSSLLFDA